MDSLRSFRSRRSAQKENEKLDGHKKSMLSALEHRRQLEEAEARRKKEAAKQRQLDKQKVAKGDLTLAVEQTLEACLQACGEIVILEDPTNEVQKALPPEELQTKPAPGWLSPAHVVQKALLSRIEAKERLNRAESRGGHSSVHSDKNSIQSAVASDTIPDETHSHESCTSQASQKSEFADRTCVSGENNSEGSWSSESEQETKGDEESDTSTTSVDTSSSNWTNSFSQVETKESLQLSPHLIEGSSVQSKSTVTTLGTSEDQVRIFEDTGAPAAAESSAQRHGSETQALEKPRLAQAQETFEQTLEDYVLLSGTRETVEDTAAEEEQTNPEREGVDDRNTLDDQELPKVVEPEPCQISPENTLLNKVPARRRRYLRGKWFSSRTPVTRSGEKQSARTARGSNRQISSSTVQREDSKPSLCEEESIPNYPTMQASSLRNASSSPDCNIITLQPTEPPSTIPSESKKSVSRSVSSTESKSGSPLSGKHAEDVVLKDEFHSLDTAAEANAVCEKLPPKRNDQISMSSGTSADELISPAAFTEDGSTHGLNSVDVDSLSSANSSAVIHSPQSAGISRLATASFSTASSFDSYSMFSDATTSVFVEDDPRRDISLSVIQEEMALLFRGDRK